MYRNIPRLSAFVFAAFAFVFTAQAQPDTTSPTSIDPKLIEWQKAKIPKEYIIAGIDITGIQFLDTAIVLSISGLQTGTQFVHPGTDVFAKAIANLWRQKLFSGVDIFVTKIDGNNVNIEINIQERPRLGNFKFVGIKKSEAEDLQSKIGSLVKGTIITENMKKNIGEVAQSFYSEKGYMHANARIEEKPDTGFINSNSLLIYISKGQKMKINEVTFFGNEYIDGIKLKKQLKGTKEMTRFTLSPVKDPSPYGEKKYMSFHRYINDWGFLSPSKTKRLLDPYFRFKLLSSAKYNQKKFEADKEKVLDFYNSAGYRDAQIITDTSYPSSNKNLNIDIKVNEGRKYYFGNITWKGNAKYPDSLLNVLLGINKGDVYNIDILNNRIGKQLSQEGGDISGLYMDDGYLFFRIEPVETAVYNDTIDHEIMIIEGPQARIKNVTIAGNDKTKDYVIRREIRTMPGELFSRADLIRSQRELAGLNYFNQETINPGVVPDASDGTVDISRSR